MIDATLGSRRANRYFWVAPFRVTSWRVTSSRLEDLGARRPEFVDHFVRESLERTADPITIASLAQHPFSRDVVSDWLSEQGDQLSESLRERALRYRLFGGAVAGAAQLLLDSDRSTALFDEIVDLYQTLDNRLFQFVDSFGSALDRSSGRPATSVIDPDGKKRTVPHRLVIAEHFADAESIALLLTGATKTTLIATSETFGHADFSAYEGWPGVGEIVVEHVRSRITRFSQPYIDLHESTAHLAQEVSDCVMELSDLTADVDERFLSVEIADFLFFQALVIRAIEVLVEDPDVDEIVLALDGANQSASFVRLVRRVTDLLDDPRLRVVSVSQSASERGNFWSLIDLLNGDTSQPIVHRRRLSMELVARKFDAEAKRLAASPSGATAVSAPVLVVTTNQHAYNDSTAVYVHELAQEYEVGILHIGPITDELASRLTELPGGTQIPIHVLTPATNRLSPVARLIGDHLQQRMQDRPVGSSPADRAAEAALQVTSGRLAAASVAPAILRMRAMHHWLDARIASGDAPSVIIVTPHRNPGVGAMEAIARRFGVPTVVVEPHAQDANYCRYVKVISDFYGVLSNYFSNTASIGFGIKAERVVTIGSPRQIAPAGYDPDSEQRYVLRRYEQAHGVQLADDRLRLVFFCQPSDWAHVAKVWTSVLEAGRRNDCRVLLKPHPEESPSRVRQYVTLAVQGGHDDVVLIDGDAADAVALADVVLTGYSAAALDAAVRLKPVISVTHGDLGYPVDIAAILGAPLARSTDELSDLISAYQDDPKVMREQARRLLDEEDQFVEGPGPRLRDLVRNVVALGPDAVRDPSDVPKSLFLDGPHPVFPV